MKKDILTAVRGSHTRKEEGAEGVVVAVVLIVVAIGICLIFKDQIGNALKNAMNSVSTNIDGLFSW